MAIIAPFVFQQFFDDNGDPLAGGKVYTYAAGTSTEKTTYTNADAGTANTNPIILDSAGRANIWLGTGGYKFIIKDSDDVTIQTVDDITGNGVDNSGNVATIADLRALTSGLYNTVDVRSYYEYGDGGEGTFYWDSDSVADDDKGTVIKPNSNPSTGRWIRIVKGCYTPRMFGIIAADFFSWASVQTTLKSVAINNNLVLSSSYELSEYIDIAEINNGAVISGAYTLTFNKFSARPRHQCFGSDLTVVFNAGATNEASVVWWGTGTTARDKLVTACAAGDVYFADTTETDKRNSMKYINGSGVALYSSLYNPSET